jgi:hypothetical protein
MKSHFMTITIHSKETKTETETITNLVFNRKVTSIRNLGSHEHSIMFY